MTPDWGYQAAELQLSSVLWRSLADQARHTDHGLRHLNTDYCAQIARLYREMADVAETFSDACRELEWVQGHQDGAA
jgi:hypothetical protein